MLYHCRSDDEVLFSFDTSRYYLVPFGLAAGHLTGTMIGTTLTVDQIIYPVNNLPKTWQADMDK